MDFTTKPKQKNPKSDIIIIENDDLYLNNVLLYRLPPIQEITLEEFEELALNRLKVLRIIEQENSKENRIYSNEWKEGIKDELNREGLKGYDRLLITGTSEKTELDVEARRADYISHFILRFSYCRSTDMKRFSLYFYFFYFSFL